MVKLAAEKKEWGNKAAIAALALIVIALAILGYAFSSQAPSPLQPGGEVALSLDPPGLHLEGGLLTVNAASECGGMNITLDGNLVASGDSLVSANISPGTGNHTLIASGNGCEQSLEFSVVKKECNDGDSRNCSAGPCGGTQECEGGLYGECNLAPKICSPSSKVGCPLDSCHFGYRTCDACGDAYGPCLPSGQIGNASCSAGSCG